MNKHCVNFDQTLNKHEGGYLYQDVKEAVGESIASGSPELQRNVTRGFSELHNKNFPKKTL